MFQPWTIAFFQVLLPYFKHRVEPDAHYIPVSCPMMDPDIRLSALEKFAGTLNREIHVTRV
jgi:hypothetical protein